MSREAIKEQLQLIEQEQEKPLPCQTLIGRRMAIARKAIRDEMVELSGLALKYEELDPDRPLLLVFIPTPDGDVDGVMLDLYSACANGGRVQFNCEPVYSHMMGGWK